ncbi:hypothetical protein CY35_12G017400 [Sphagnum magellanicum]|nr:hypothetical protein CY35_12G017400 [Sphagnum magellanicum]
MNRKAGDWNCPSCQHMNFSRRDACLRCNEPRPGGGGGGNNLEHGDQYLSHSSRGGIRDGSGSGYGFGRDGDYGGGGGGARSYGGNFGGFSSNNVGVRPGDWYCPSSGCGAHNFASRNNCFKCGAFKDDGGPSLGAGGGGSSQGYDSGRGGGGGGRSSSYGFGQSYNAGGGSGGGARQGWKSGDWICGRSGCNEHNFASRMECYRCSAPRETGTTM